MRKQKEPRLGRICGDLKYPLSQVLLTFVGWLKRLNLTIEGFTLTRRLKRFFLQCHRLPFSPNTSRYSRNRLAQCCTSRPSFFTILVKQAIEQDHVSGSCLT